MSEQLIDNCAFLVEEDYKGSYSRYALTIAEFYEAFRECLNKNPSDPFLNEADSFTPRPLVHVWYRFTEIGGDSWNQFFTDMLSGLSEMDIQNRNYAHIDYEKIGALKKEVLKTVEDDKK